MSSSFLSKDTVYINSRNRNSGTSSDFIINLADQIRQNNNYDSISLLTFSCYKSYYLINSYNNTFILTENGFSSTITIPVGNYKASTLKTALQTALAGHTYTYVVIFSTLLAKYTVTVSGNAGIQPYFNFTSNNGIGDILGFESSTYQFSANVLTSINGANLQLTNTIQINASIVENNILGVIIPNSGDFGSISYTEQAPEYASHKLTNKNLQSARFWLMDGNNGNALDLNGLEFSMSIAVFKSNDYFEKILYDKKMGLIIDELKNNNE